MIEFWSIRSSDDVCAPTVDYGIPSFRDAEDDESEKGGVYDKGGFSKRWYQSQLLLVSIWPAEQRPEEMRSWMSCRSVRISISQI